MDVNYTKQNAVFEDGDWWYKSPSGYRQRVSTHAAKNLNRMFVDGIYIKKSEVDKSIYRAGRWRSWSHAKVSLEQLQKSKKGHIYAITNPAFSGWVKVGQAVNPKDRLKQYQTSSPFRDYKLNFSFFTENKEQKEKQIHKVLMRTFDYKNEWFKIDLEILKEIFDDYSTD